jgi:CYTH domain-containing protein
MPLEIERRFLLRGPPAIPAHAETLRMEQGYLPTDGGDGGRIRRATDAEGRVLCTHTIKRGFGLVREETEREITPQDFAREWPRTQSRRLTKTRYRVAEAGADGVVWEIDVYDGLDLVLAEVELPDPDAPVALPAWLAPYVAREVTGEPEYSNYEIALRARRAR